MNKIISILLILTMTIGLTACSGVKYDKVEILPTDGDVVRISKNVLNEINRYKVEPEVFVQTEVAIGAGATLEDEMSYTSDKIDYSKLDMVKDDGNEFYWDNGLQYMFLNKQGKNYTYDLNQGTITPMQFEGEVFVNPFLDDYIKVLQWSIENPEKFEYGVQDTEAEKEMGIKIYLLKCTDGEFIKSKYEEAFGDYEWWTELDITSTFAYTLTNEGVLTQIMWYIHDAEEFHTMETNTWIGTEVEGLYAEMGEGVEDVWKLVDGE